MEIIHRLKIWFLKSKNQMEILVLILFSLHIYALLTRIKMCVHYNTVLFYDPGKFQNKQFLTVILGLYLALLLQSCNKVLGREEEVPVTHRAASCKMSLDYYWGMLNYFSSFLPDYCVLELQNNTLNQIEMDDWILYKFAEHCRSRIKCFKSTLLYAVVRMTCQDINMLYLCCEEWSKSTSSQGASTGILGNSGWFSELMSRTGFFAFHLQVPL